MATVTDFFIWVCPQEQVDFERMEGEEKIVETKEGAIITFPWQVQRQIPSPTYQTPNKVQRETGQLPPITGWRNELMWVNYTVIIEEPSEVEQLKVVMGL